MARLEDKVFLPLPLKNIGGDECADTSPSGEMRVRAGLMVDRGAGALSYDSNVPPGLSA